MSWSLNSSKFGFLELLVAVLSREWLRLFAPHPIQHRGSGFPVKSAR